MLLGIVHGVSEEKLIHVDGGALGHGDDAVVVGVVGTDHLLFYHCVGALGNVGVIIYEL